MKSLLAFTILSFISMNIHAQEYHFKEEFLQKWQNTKTYTLKVASLMPDNKYDYTPDSNTRTFAEQLQHISDAMLYHAGLTLDIAEEKQSVSSSKQEILSQLKSRFDLVEEAIQALDAEDFEEKVKFWDGPTTRRKLLNLTYDHITHHRGQAIIYLRMNGIKPPDYIGW